MATAGALAVMLGGATRAFACIETCMSRYGELVYSGGSTYYEFEYCSERFNSTGGISTTCYYSVHNI
jgi:hypothetical protein